LFRKCNDYNNDHDDDRDHDHVHDHNDHIERNNLINGYTTDEINYEQMKKYYNSTHQLYNMEPELIGFVQKHNVVMDDGAVINKMALLKQTILNKKNQKRFQPPKGLSMKMFIILIILTIVLIPLIIIGIIIGIIYIYNTNIPNLPYALPWWRRSLIYQINIETWANDVQGPIGRLQDIIPPMNNTQLRKCSPIWLVHQLSEDNKDFETIQKLAYFLPDYNTYWPININLINNGKQRLYHWKLFIDKSYSITLLNTPNDKNQLISDIPKITYNLLIIYRHYINTIYRIYFIVSFQTLNTHIPFQSIFSDISSLSQLKVVYDSKNLYYNKKQLNNNELLVNNQVLLIYYY
ncbi:uncharacterized protein DC041_0006017, partial [Schistosoma bovis]